MREVPIEVPSQMYGLPFIASPGLQEEDDVEEEEEKEEDAETRVSHSLLPRTFTCESGRKTLGVGNWEELEGEGYCPLCPKASCYPVTEPDY